MEKGRGSQESHRYQGSSSHHEIVSPRVSLASPRISGIDYPVADGFGHHSHPEVSPAVSPTPEDDERPSHATRSASSPIMIRTAVRSSMLKESPSDEHMAGPSHIPFDPNRSRFVRPGSAQSQSYSPESPSSYRDRISRVSFSYPRRSPSAASQTRSNGQAAHPYALYQQTTFEEPEETDHVPQPVPVGYYGRPTGQQFRRRTGPEGEELDVIGPDGHLEQLPPYTRYPMAGPVRNKQVQMEPVSPVSTGGSNTSSPIVPFQSHSVTSSPMLPFQGVPISAQVSPLVRQESIPMTPIARQQSHQSQHHPYPEPNPLHSHPNTQLSSRGSGNSANSRALQSSASSLAEVKPDEANLKQKKKQRYVCGFIPLWALLLVAFIAIFLAIIAGGVIGGLLSQQRGKQKER
jgi:hypothetical protein